MTATSTPTNNNSDAVAVTTTGYAPPCPPWCTDKLGCDEWQQYNDHQWRAHETHLSAMELAPEYPEGPGELQLRLSMFSDETYSVNWNACTLEHRLASPVISLHVTERVPTVQGCHEAELRPTAAAALELADSLRLAAARLQCVEEAQE